MGCLLALLLLFFGIIWFLILRYIGFTPPDNGCWRCEFPEDYTMNLFGEMWIWSPVWFPIILIMTLYIREWFFHINLLQIKETLLLSKKKIELGLIVCATIALFTISLDFYMQRITTINEFSDTTLKEQFYKEISDISRLESDYFNKNLDVAFSSEFENLNTSEQYIILNYLRSQYLTIMQDKGFWENITEEQIKVSALIGYRSYGILEGELLSNTDNENFNGSTLSKNAKNPTGTILLYNRSEEMESEGEVSDSSCNNSRGLAKSMCKEQLKLEYCGQYMGSYMKDGKMVNWGKKQNTYELEKCIQENISP